MRFIRYTFDVDAELVGNESADIIRGKDFSRSRCLLTPFQAGDGHDKAPESVKHWQWTMKSAPQYGLGRSCSPTYSCYASTNRQSRQATTGRYVTSAPHCRAMWIRLTESRSADGTNQAAGC